MLEFHPKNELTEDLIIFISYPITLLLLWRS